MAASLKDTLANATSDEVDIDFSGAGESLGDLQNNPPGTYNVRVSECEVGTSGSGNPKVVFVFELDQKNEGCWPSERRHCPTSGKGSGILKDTLAALGYDIAAIESGKERFKPSSALGRQAIIVVGPQKDKPEYNEIKKIKAVPGAKPAAGRRSRSKLG